MIDYTKTLPTHIEKYVGENDLFLEIYLNDKKEQSKKRPPLLFVHGAYTGSWMWSKFISHFVSNGWNCYVMNFRSHYKSRNMDMTKISFEDYMEDLREMIAECKEQPILIGFSMGGILSQKIAEEVNLAGLILIDATICKEVYDLLPYEDFEALDEAQIVEPAPDRDELFSMDESAEDIAFQKKYLSMESSKARNSYFNYKKNGGIFVDNRFITCNCLVITQVNNEADELRGNAVAEYFHGEYTGFWDTTHTGLLIGQRYKEVVDRILVWLNKYYINI